MSETILIVDDTPANLCVLVETLGAAGYRLMVAEDGEEALAQTAQTVPDLILLDVMMPGIDGFETCRRLRAQPTTADTPVLFMTALNETPDKVKAFAAGGVDYITKPIEHEEALARVRTHLTLRRLRHELAEQLAIKEQFMRIAGHDLRNPVCLILMAVELARRSAGKPELLGEHLTSIADSVAQIRRIIDTFLGIKMPLAGCADAGAVDLALLAAAVARQYAPMAERKQIALSVDAVEQPMVARGDATLAYQALANLVSNALKYTPPHGRVQLGTRLTGEVVRVEVSDSGPGVPAAERDGLFTAGRRLSPRPTADEESHGHGLAIVKQIVAAQGGSVGADFPAGGGSVFWFQLPGAATAERPTLRAR
ncbi:hybrid sensor histidine kinase/response regulator [Opitutus terrae]|uniref:histidine kinase n=1 Tax=Opitutus terrae (strain DSM 11246 / JCM 15787 / PB90-1) TaxID=452637 RepID=B1ZVK0_OPITP|nr:hybrid sensor histidine kinase/response regulator [Opitutus terrae]ACB74097.1 response regulator receiver sensor signal transduction histidine kinase [Opitutus terrae PB90-1]